MTVFFLTVASATCFASFPINAIDCSDSTPSSESNVFFTTHDASANKYTRRDGAIPCNYGNSTRFSHTSQTGQMTLDASAAPKEGTISLIDSSDSQNPSKLVLIQTSTAGRYLGLLSGHIETKNGWEKISNYRLLCIVQ